MATYTFDASLPTAKDRVRLRLGDTNVPSNVILADESIVAMLALYPGSENEATALLALAMAAHYAKLATEWENDEPHVIYLNRAEEYKALALEIRRSVSPTAPQSAGAAVGQMRQPDLTNYRTD